MIVGGVLHWASAIRVTLLPKAPVMVVEGGEDSHIIAHFDLYCTTYGSGGPDVRNVTD